MTANRLHLTPLDQRVLGQVPPHKGRRARDIAWTLHAETPQTVRQVLRGLARFGYVTQTGGWWRRA